MPLLDTDSRAKILTLTGWEPKDSGKWSHNIYSPEAIEEPDLNAPENYWWLLEWLLSHDYRVSFTGTKESRSNKRRYFCVIKKGKGRWVARDLPHRNTNRGLLSGLLKILQFPEGMPRKQGDYIRKLLGKHNKELPKPQKSISKKINELESLIDDLDTTTPSEQD